MTALTISHTAQRVQLYVQLGLRLPRTHAIVKHTTDDEIRRFSVLCPKLQSFYSRSTRRTSEQEIMFTLTNHLERNSCSLKYLLTLGITQRLRFLSTDCLLSAEVQNKLGQPTQTFPNLQKLRLMISADSTSSRIIQMLSKWTQITSFELDIHHRPDSHDNDFDLSGFGALPSLKKLKLKYTPYYRVDRQQKRTELVNLAHCLPLDMGLIRITYEGRNTYNTALEDMNMALAARMCPRMKITHMSGRNYINFVA